MSHARSSFRRTSGSKRITEWAQGPFSSGVDVATASGNNLIDTGQEFLQAGTLVRLRGELAIWVVVATAPFDGFTSYSAGIGIVTADAFAVGASAMPSPRGDADWSGWIWHHSGAAIVEASTTESTQGLASVRLAIDSKAMRKVGVNEVVFGAVSFQTEVGTATVNFVLSTRMLVKLH